MIEGFHCCQIRRGWRNCKTVYIVYGGGYCHSRDPDRVMNFKTWFSANIIRRLKFLQQLIEQVFNLNGAQQIRKEFAEWIFNWMLSALTVLSAGADMRHQIELVVALSFNVLLQPTCLTFCNTSKKSKAAPIFASLHFFLSRCCWWRDDFFLWNVAVGVTFCVHCGGRKETKRSCQASVWLPHVASEVSGVSHQ